MGVDLKGLKVVGQGKARPETATERWDFCKTCPYLTKANRKDVIKYLRQMYYTPIMRTKKLEKKRYYNAKTK